MKRKAGLATLIAGAALVLTPATALARDHGDHHRDRHSYSDSRHDRHEWREHERHERREHERRFYSSPNYSSPYYAAPYGYGPSYGFSFSWGSQPHGYYDQFGYWHQY